MPSPPWAWAVTWRPMRWAASTMAFSSSWVNCWPSPAAVLESTPPVAVILMTSAPRQTCSRTARRQSSAPEQTELGAQHVHDVVAEAVDVAVAAVDRDRRARGDDPRARHVAARRWRRAARRWRRCRPPRSATVVKPASSVLPRVAGADHRLLGRRLGDLLQPRVGVLLAGEVDVAVDQARQHEAVLQVDHARRGAVA